MTTTDDRDKAIKIMLRELKYEDSLGALSENTAEFVTSLNEYYETNKRLTEKQEIALRKIYRQHIGGLDLQTPDMFEGE